MPEYSSIEAMLLYLQKQVNETLKDEVAKETTDTVIEKAQTDVYDPYDPIMHNRRHSLINPENYQSNLVESGTIEIYPVAEPSESVFGTPYNNNDPTIFAEWINEGEVPNVFNDRDYVWMHERPFITDAKKELQTSSKIVNALKKGLIKRGVSNEIKVSVK